MKTTTLHLKLLLAFPLLLVLAAHLAACDERVRAGDDPHAEDVVESGPVRGDASPDSTAETGPPVDLGSGDAPSDAPPIDDAAEDSGEDGPLEDVLDSSREDTSEDTGTLRDQGQLDVTGEEASDDDCEALVVDLSERLWAVAEACTVIVRLDYETRAMIGYQLVCGRYGFLDEGGARARAESDTGYGEGITKLNEDAPPDEWVFYQSPGDFGGAAAVSANTGLSVFGGSIIWMGTGTINTPSSWRDAAELGVGCDPSGGISCA